ncbi:MAG: response regulator [Chloroflexota bacterium]
MAHILVVDDDYDVLRMMEFTLKRANHQPTITTDPEQGLILAEQERPDLIIVDIMMPRMTGYDFTRQIRAQANGADVPIIIYSARAQSVDQQAALEAGATDYMPKTVAPQEIIERVDSLLGESVKQDSDIQSQTLACFSLRGGVGVTSIAVNLSVILAITQKTKICLADLNTMGGHTNLLLGLRPTKNIATLLQTPEDLTREILNSHITPHDSGVQLLASPLESEGNNIYDKGNEIVKVAKLGYRFTVLDLPHDLTHLPTELLASLNKILLLVAPEIPSVQSAIAAVNHLEQLGIDADKVALVLNHNTATPAVKLEALEKALPRTIVGAIPYDNQMPAAIGAGKPLVLFNQKSPTAAALARLAAKIIL